MNAATGKLPLGRGVKWLKAQHGIIALEKPAGIRSHPNKPGVDKQSLLAAPYDKEQQAYILEAEEGGKPRLVHLLHRLDAPTSGVILLADDAAVANAVREAFRQNKVQKTYYAVTPILPSLRPAWEDKLSRNEEGGKVRVVAGRGGLPAITHVKQLKARRTTPKLMLLKLEPKTGRTHQLRIQCAHRRIAILGDTTYGHFVMNRRITEVFGVKRLCLHAGEIEVTVSLAGRKLAFKAESALPEEFDIFF